MVADCNGFSLPQASPFAISTHLSRYTQLIREQATPLETLPNMRFTIALAFSFASTALHATGAGALAVRQQCTVDCACLDQNRNRFWEATERCCRPNGGVPDTPVWSHPLISQFLRFAQSRKMVNC